MAFPANGICLLNTMVTLITAVAVGANGVTSDPGQTSSVSPDKVVVVVSDGVDITTGACGGVDSEGADFERVVISYADVVNDILKEMTNSSTGIMVIQTDCLDTDTAIQRIFKLLAIENITGILTLTQKHTTEALLAVTQHLNIPLVEFASRDQIVKDSTNPLHYVVPDYKYLQMQNVFLTANHLNWTAVSVTSSNSDVTASGMSLDNVFKKMASENDICVIPPLPGSHVPIVMLQSSTRHSIKPTTEYDANTILVVEDLGTQNIEDAASMLKSNHTDNHVMILRSLETKWMQVVAAIELYCNRSSNDTAKANVGICLEINNLHNATRNTKSAFIRVVSSLSLLLHLSNNSVDFSHCNNPSLECLLLNDGLPKIDPKTNMLLVKEDDFQIEYISDNSSKIQEFTHHSSDGGSLYLPKDLPLGVYSKTCGELCTYCASCHPTKMSDDKIMTSGMKDFSVIGFFPIHTLSADGHCNIPNPNGYAQALTFLHGIQTHFSQTKTKTVSNIQGVIFDSCGSADRVEKIITDLEQCRHEYREKINGSLVTRSFQPSSIVGYFDSMNYLQKDFSKENVPILSVDKTGFSVPIDLKKTFVDNMMLSLIRLGWTTLNVIVSNEDLFLTFAKHLKDSSLSMHFCFVNEIVLNSGKAERHDDYEIIFMGIEKTPLLLLLTNYEDGQDILQTIASAELKKKVSLVFTPWNQDLSQMSQVNKISEVNLILKPSPKYTDVQLVSALKKQIQTTSSSWSEDFKDMLDIEDILNKAEVELGLVQRATEAILDAIESNSHLMPEIRQEIISKSTGLDVVAFYMGRGVQNIIAQVDGLYTQQTFFNGPSHVTCKGWCPACNACKTKTQTHHPNLHRKGDLILTGVYPLHSSGQDSTGCGPVQSNVDQLLKIQAFMFAIDTAKKRYPDLLPGIEIGGLVLDSCSNPYTALKVVANFETCTVRFGGSSNRLKSLSNTDTHAANPTQNLGYFIENNKANDDNSDKDISDMVKNVLHSSKYDNAVITTEDIHIISARKQIAMCLANAFVHLLKRLAWNKFVVLTEKQPQFENEVKILLSTAKNEDLCVVASMYFDTTALWRIENSFKQHAGLPVILLSSKMGSLILFDWLKTRGSEYNWIIPVTSDDWGEFPNTADFIPVGSIVLDLKSKHNQDFDNFLRNSTIDGSVLFSMSSWYHDFWRQRFSCAFPRDTAYTSNSFKICPSTTPVSDVGSLSPTIANVVQTVDAVLHGVHAKYVSKCPNRTGICDSFAEDVIHGELSSLRNVTFSYQGEQLGYNSDGEPIPTLSIFNVQRNGFVEVGSFFRLVLSLNVSKILMYSANGSELTEFPPASCVSDCPCIDSIDEISNSSVGELKDYLYKSTQGEFIDELWAIIIVAIAGTGAFLCLTFSIYVVYKVCKGALGKRYVGLGLLLLFSLIVLNLSVLPFVFSASDEVCGLRYLLTGLSFALCFAVILEKLMTLQNYKLIGLGGEVSGFNQFITVVFIFGVQLAFGIQWWVHEAPTMHSKVDASGELKYACNFNREDFAFYHIYVIFLIIVCSLYAIAVRKEKKNMGEAKLLLVSSWICLVIWVTWLLCFFFIDREWSDVIVCAAILSCATTIMMIVFIPKIRMVSRLKYDISQKGNLRNGYSVDTDFLYERPYSLPGTLTSTYSSSMKMTYPKTFTNFDSEVNY